MKDETVTRSSCCGAKVSVNGYYTVEMKLEGTYPEMFCVECGEECTPVFLPKYREVTKGIFRPTNY